MLLILLLKAQVIQRSSPVAQVQRYTVMTEQQACRIPTLLFIALPAPWLSQLQTKAQVAPLVLWCALE